MNAKVNPFRPNSPVNPGMFVGRLDEINSLEQSLLQTQAESPTHFMITGERGIGKTSLLLYLKYIAAGDFAVKGRSFKFLIIDVDIDNATTQLGLVERIRLAIDRELGKTEVARAFLTGLWDFIQRIRVKEIGLSPKTTSESEEILLDEFSYSLSQLSQRCCYRLGSDIFGAQYDGILILIDEADNFSAKLNLGSFVKIMLERLQRHGCNRVLVGLAGLPELRTKLHASHPSALRIFEELPLGRLSDAEVGSIIDICIKTANETNEEKTFIAADAKQSIINYSEGYPHFIQQFGYSAFSADVNGTIENDDVLQGSFGPKGALESIGNRYYRDNFYNKIQKDSYRQVLRIMADDLDGWVSRAKIREKFKGNNAILNNALKALRDRHIILSKEGERGVYRLQHRGFALWIKFYADPDFLKALSQAATHLSALPPTTSQQSVVPDKPSPSATEKQ